MALLPSKSSHPSFLRGVSALTLSALAVKVMGLFYRIPLLSLLGTEGMGYFNTAYEVYALLCVLATAGLPVAMSALIAARRGEAGAGERVYREARVILLAIGAAGALLLWLASAPLSELLGNPPAAPCMRAVAPTLFLICLSSAYRGYFQGEGNMTPTAVSQVMEAGGKLTLGLLFATMARRAGRGIPETAALAALGLTLGTALSVAYLAIHKRLAAGDGQGMGTPIPSAEAASRKRDTRRALLAIALPATVSAGVVSLTKCIDLALILHRLQDGGYTAARANSLYGCYSTLAVPLFNLVPSLTTSVALSAVPAISAALGRGREGEAEARRVAVSALRLTLWVAIPAALGLSVYAEDILSLLFRGQSAAVAEATPWLSALALSVPAACLVTVTGAMLQAVGRAACPVVSMAVGVGAKTLFGYLLLPCPAVGMMAAPLGSILCDTLIVGCNLCFLARHAPALLPTGREGADVLLLPLLPATLSVAAVEALRRGLGAGDVSSLYTLLSVGGVAALYAGGSILLHLLKQSLHIQAKETQHEQADENRAG